MFFISISSMGDFGLSSMDNLSVVGSGVEMGLQCSMSKRFRILSMYRDCESDICPSLVFHFNSIPEK